MKSLVLDSFALMAYYKDEIGSKKVSRIIDEASEGEIKLYLHVINWGEVYYSFFRKSGEKGAAKIEKLISSLPVEIFEDFSKRFVKQAAVLKGKYSMSYADCFAVNLAIKKKVRLASGDLEIAKVAKKERGLRLLWLGKDLI